MCRGRVEVHNESSANLITFARAITVRELLRVTVHCSINLVPASQVDIDVGPRESQNSSLPMTTGICGAREAA